MILDVSPNHHLCAYALPRRGGLFGVTIPGAISGKSLMLLAGPTKPDRSLGKRPCEACIQVRQRVWLRVNNPE